MAFGHVDGSENHLVFLIKSDLLCCGGYIRSKQLWPRKKGVAGDVGAVITVHIAAAVRSPLSRSGGDPPE